MPSGASVTCNQLTGLIANFSRSESFRPYTRLLLLLLLLMLLLSEIICRHVTE
jgi:hypothetical protein